jgi:hypothetical protein
MSTGVLQGGMHSAATHLLSGAPFCVVITG